VDKHSFYDHLREEYVKDLTQDQKEEVMAPVVV
jgi:hypothetical protein